MDSTPTPWDRKKAAAAIAEVVLPVVAKTQGVSITDMRARDRVEAHAHARQVATWILREVGGLAHGQIGTAIGHRSRTGVLGILRTVEKHRAMSPTYRTGLDELCELCREVLQKSGLEPVPYHPHGTGVPTFVDLEGEPPEGDADAAAPVGPNGPEGEK